MTVFNKKCVAYKLRKLFEEALMVLFLHILSVALICLPSVGEGKLDTIPKDLADLKSISRHLPRCLATGFTLPVAYKISFLGFLYQMVKWPDARVDTRN